MHNLHSMTLILCCSKYDDMCTLLDRMIDENWAGIMRDVGHQIQSALDIGGVNASQCPYPPQTLSVDNGAISLPEIPAGLSLFAAVSQWAFSFYVLCR